MPAGAIPFGLALGELAGATGLTEFEVLHERSAVYRC
jgi:hypothetical protein